MKTKLLILHLLIPLLALAQIAQIGVDIDGEAEWDQSGWSVSLSSDGSIVAIGAIYNDGNGSDSGHVRVFQNSGGVWMQIGEDIDGEAVDDHSGYSVSLSADGSILAIGAVQNDGSASNSGHVRVYQNTGGSWSKMGADIEGEAANDQSGWSLSLSADGSTLAVGAPYNDGNGADSGHVRVFKYIGSNWVQIGSDIDGEAAEDYSGNSISLSHDGNILAIGAPGNDGNGADFGHVRVYRNIGGTWTQIGDDIDGEEVAGLGCAVALSADGSFVAIGADLNSDNGDMSGQVRVFRNAGGSWVQRGQDINGEAVGDHSGWPVSINANGNIVAIGAVWNNGSGLGSGQVRVYQYIGATWVQIGQDIDGEAEGDHSGCSISLNDEGSIVAIGAIWNFGSGMASGHVRVFDLRGVMGISENSLGEFSFYPNPTKNVIHIAGDLSIAQIQVFNSLGQLVLSNTDQNTIDISSVSQGIYFIKVKDVHGNIGTQQVVKK